jgi:hypothetical protein
LTMTSLSLPRFMSPRPTNAAGIKNPLPKIDSSTSASTLYRPRLGPGVHVSVVTLGAQLALGAGQWSSAVLARMMFARCQRQPYAPIPRGQLAL